MRFSAQIFFLVFQPEMKRVEIGFLQSEVFTERWSDWFSTKWKQRSCLLQLRKDVICVSIDSFRLRWQKSLVKEDWLNLLGGSVIWELLMIQYQGLCTSGPGKQLVGRTPSCLCFAFWPLHTEPPIIDNLPFVEPFLLGIALQSSVFDNEPHPVQQSHWGQGGGGGGGGGGEIIIQNNFVQKQWLTVVANGILWGTNLPEQIALNTNWHLMMKWNKNDIAIMVIASNYKKILEWQMIKLQMWCANGSNDCDK